MTIRLRFCKETKTANRVTTTTTDLTVQRSSEYKESVTIDQNRKSIFVECEYGAHEIDISDIGEWGTLTVSIDDEEEEED